MYIKKAAYGLLILFDSSGHQFNQSDTYFLSLFTSTLTSVAENIIELRCNRRKALMDPLTSLLNRQAFIARTDFEINRSRRYNHCLSLCLFDIDFFKDINDRYGHATGDRALILLANTCRRMLREFDIIARYGGDEFTILFTETTQEAAFEVIERIRHTVTQLSIPLQSGTLQLSLSIGLTSLSTDCATTAKLIARADSAMYHAKFSGRNRTVCWSQSIEQCVAKLV